MKKLISCSIKYRKISLFILIMLLILGSYSYYIIPKQENPEIVAPVAMVTVVYPGASPDDINELVTIKIEDEVKELKGYDYGYSHSANSVSVTVVRLKYGVDIDKAWDDLRQRMDDLQSQLPAECNNIEVNTNLIETAGIIISMSGDNYTYEELVDIAEELRDELIDVDGISRFDIVGKQEKNLVIEVDREKMNYFSLSYSDLINLLKSQNIEIPSGSLQSGDDKINVKSTGKLQSADEIKDIVIGVSSENGSIARLGDISKVYFEEAESNFKIYQDGKAAVLLTGYFENGKNIVLAGKDVSTIIDEFSKKIPDDIQFYQAHYQPDTVADSVDSFIKNLIQGVIFVIIIVFIGMGLRNSIIVSTAIPSSILITFLAMRYLDIEIHQISVAALIVSLGMLVDNAIVVSDSIQVKLDEGHDKLKACIDGTHEVAIPVLTSTLTTIAAFSPLLLLSSLAGEYISSLPMIVMISLGVSYLLAIFITPVMAFMFFKKSKPKVHKNIIRHWFSNLLRYGLKHRLMVVVMSAGAFCLTIYIALNLGLQFFPFADADIIYIDIKSEKAADIDSTNALAMEVIKYLEDDETALHTTVAVGGGLPKFYNTLLLVTPSQDVGQVLVKVDMNNIGKGKKYQNLTSYVEYLQSKFDGVITGGNVIVKQLEQGEPIGSPVRIRITGDDMETLREVSGRVKELLREIPGTSNIEDDFSDEIYQYVINVDDKKANYMGMTKYDIQNEVSIALRGREAGVFRKNNKEYDIIVKSDIDNKTQLENLGIKSSFSNSKVYLKSMSNIELKKEHPYIKKFNGKKSVQVYSDVKSGYSAVEIQNIMNDKLESEDLQGCKIIFDGEREKIKENFGDITEQSVLAIFLVFLILLIQFKKFAQPLVILITIPLSVVGSILGLFLFGQKLSFVAALGIVSLLGIVVNNAIVLIDFIDSERRIGKSVEDSCYDAVEKRFRPIMLSTITTIIGLTPLAFAGGELFKSMSVALMSGLMVSTLLTLVVIPVVYSMGMDKSEHKRVNKAREQLLAIKKSK